MKFRNWLISKMAGRYGGDQLGRALNAVTVVCLVLSVLTRRSVLGNVFSVIGLFSIAWSTFRMLSRNVEKRRRENAAWLRFYGKYSGECQGCIQRFRQRKEYKFFRCPSCRARLRVPRGKGKLNITCRQCGERFIRKT